VLRISASAVSAIRPTLALAVPRLPPSARNQRQAGVRDLGPGTMAAAGVAHVCFLRKRSSACRCRLDPGRSRYRPISSVRLPRSARSLFVFPRPHAARLRWRQFDHGAPSLRGSARTPLRRIARNDLHRQVESSAHLAPCPAYGENRARRADCFRDADCLGADDAIGDEAVTRELAAAPAAEDRLRLGGRRCRAGPCAPGDR
jgi:hypothetical protein